MTPLRLKPRPVFRQPDTKRAVRLDTLNAAERYLG